MKSTLVRVGVFLALTAGMLYGQATANPKFPANANGRVMVTEFQKWAFQSQVGVSSGAQTVTLNGCYVKVGTAYELFYPIAVNVPLLITDPTGGSETVTPTAVSQPTLVTGPSTISPYNCTFTATFANAHTTPGFYVSSGDAGLEEAINYAAGLPASGIVSLTSDSGITNTMITAAVPYQTVTLEDLRTPQLQYWNMTPSTTTTVAAPATLTAVTALPSATPVGAYGTGTYHLAIAYVDAMGNEGQPSADFSEAGLATGSFIFSAPAASAGAVGYVPYISLTSGTYALAYRVPLTSSICTLTKLETTIAACAVTNATYGQTGAVATVTAITVNTARIWVGLGGTSTTADLVGNSAARTTYAYAPSSHPGIFGVSPAYTAFAGATAPATTVPAIVGTIQLPAGFMNYVGRTVRICGLVTEASAGSTSTITQFNLVWDADGSNTTGAGVLLGGPKTTSTLPGSAADQWYFCQNLKTTVSGAGVTAGSIQAGAGFLSETSGVNGTATAVGWGNAPTIGAATVASLNLAGEARIDINYIHTIGTDGAAPTLTDLTVEVLN